MWNAMQYNNLGGKFDKVPGDRKVVTTNSNQTFEPVTVIIKIFNGKFECSTQGGRMSSEEDSNIAVMIPTVLKNYFAPSKPKDKETKKLDDCNTIDV